MKHAWNIDVLACPKCGGGMTPMAIIEDEEQARRFLGHIGQATVHERARGPPELAA